MKGEPCVFQGCHWSFCSCRTADVQNKTPGHIVKVKAEFPVLAKSLLLCKLSQKSQYLLPSGVFSHMCCNSKKKKIHSESGPRKAHQQSISRKEQRQQRRSREEPQSQVLPGGHQLPSQHHGRILGGSAHPSLAPGVPLQWVSALLYWSSLVQQFPDTSGSPSPQPCFVLGFQTLTTNTTKPNSILSQAGSTIATSFISQAYEPRILFFMSTCAYTPTVSCGYSSPPLTAPAHVPVRVR